MPERSPEGRSIVTRRAIIDIVQTAVQGSYGVTGLADPSFRRRVMRWLGLARPGIRLSVEGGLSLDLYLTVAYGVPVAEVARQVDSAVRYALRRALGVEASCVSVHVDGLRYQATPAAAPTVPAAPAGPSPATTATTTTPTPPATAGAGGSPEQPDAEALGTRSDDPADQPGPRR